MNKTIVLALCIAVALAGCAMGPEYRRPELNVPDSFRAQQQTPGEKSLADISWWELYQEKVLQELIRVALEQNRDVGIAAARVAEARALVGASRLAQWPQISVGAGAARSRTPLAARTPGIDERRTVYEASLDMSFEIDLWGRLSSLTDAARADLLSTEFARESVRVSLIGDVATAYFDLLSLDQQLRITHQTVATRERFLELTQSRFRQGVSSGLEVDRAEASLALARASLPELERQIEQTENQLKALLGQYPSPIVRERMQLETMPIPPSVPAGLPAALLERRPDLRQAEFNLVGANALLKSTKAELFPSIVLTGSLGSQSLAFSDLFTGPARAWSFGLSLLQPLLDANRNRYQVDAARAREEQAILQYHKTVEQAFREVSDALIARQRFAEFQQEQEVQVAALRSANQHVLRRYETGYSSYFEVVDAQRDLFDAELQLVSAYRNNLVSLVQLYKALGGGWGGPTQDEQDASHISQAGDVRSEKER